MGVYLKRKRAAAQAQECAGPPVVLFPSLAGSIMECCEEAHEECEGHGARVWLSAKHLLYEQAFD